MVVSMCFWSTPHEKREEPFNLQKVPLEGGNIRET